MNMEYSPREQNFDKWQLVTGFTGIGLIFALQFIILPILEGLGEFTRFFRNYGITLSLFILTDFVLTIKILKVSIDYEKHKFYRMNIGVLAAVVFAHLFFLLSVVREILIGHLSAINDFTSRFPIITVLFLLKGIIQIQIFNLFQHTYSTMAPLE